MLKLADLNLNDPNDQIFSHLDEKTGETRHFSVLKLEELAKAYPDQVELCVSPVQKEYAQFLAKTRGLTRDGLRRAELRLQTPLLVCTLDEGREDESALIVDGSHRYVALAKAGQEEFTYLRFPEEIWRKALVALPADLNSLAHRHLPPGALELAQTELDQRLRQNQERRANGTAPQTLDQTQNQTKTQE